MPGERTAFQQALLDTTLSGFADIPAERDIVYDFSAAFERKSEQLLRHTKQPGWYYVNTGLKRALLAAAIAVLLVMTAMAIEPIRKAVIGWFVHNDTVAYSFTFDAETRINAPDTIETVYLPGYLPDGYAELDRTSALASIDSIYGNERNALIVFTQNCLPKNPADSDWLGINSEETATAYKTIDGYQVLWVEHASDLTLAWTNHEYVFTLFFGDTTDIPENEIFTVFQGVQAQATPSQ